MGKGRGWHGDRKRHIRAAKLGHTRRDMGYDGQVSLWSVGVRIDGQRKTIIVNARNEAHAEELARKKVKEGFRRVRA